jgi:Sec-independent protein translocase protein TatA
LGGSKRLLRGLIRLFGKSRRQFRDSLRGLMETTRDSKKTHGKGLETPGARLFGDSLSVERDCLETSGRLFGDSLRGLIRLFGKSRRQFRDSLRGLMETTRDSKKTHGKGLETPGARLFGDSLSVERDCLETSGRLFGDSLRRLIDCLKTHRKCLETPGDRLGDSR